MTSERIPAWTWINTYLMSCSQMRTFVASWNVLLSFCTKNLRATWRIQTIKYITWSRLVVCFHLPKRFHAKDLIRGNNLFGSSGGSYGLSWRVANLPGLITTEVAQNRSENFRIKCEVVRAEADETFASLFACSFISLIQYGQYSQVLQNKI